MADLLSTIAGGVLAIAGGFAAKFAADRREENSLRSAFIGELRALKKLVDRQELMQKIDQRIERIQKEQSPSFFRANILSTYNTVFLANAGKLGVLHQPAPERIIDVYSHMAAVVEMIAISKQARDDQKNGRLTGSLQYVEACLEFHKRLRALMRDTRNLLINLINDLEGVTAEWQSRAEKKI